MTNEMNFSSMKDETTEEEYITIQTSTKRIDEKQKSVRIESNIIWMMLLIIFFCLLMILSSIIYGIWTISSHYRFIWYIPYEYPIEFLSRKSISSSTNRLETLEQICNDENVEKNSFDRLTIDTFQSNLSDLHSYF